VDIGIDVFSVTFLSFEVRLSEFDRNCFPCLQVSSHSSFVDEMCDAGCLNFPHTIVGSFKACY
jgi:hypothetical protein